MIELPQDDGLAETFQLLPDTRTTRGLEPMIPMPTTASIEFTVPKITPLTQALVADDVELAAFWQAEAGRYKYDYVTFRVSFFPQEDAHFEKAWVELKLGDTATDGGLIAWSMSPQQVTDTTKIKDSGTLGADFKLAKVNVTLAREAEVSTLFLRAYREQTPKPYWEFNSTENNVLAGTFRLHLVVRSSVGSATSSTATATARAVLGRRTFWIFRSRNPSEPASIVFDLPGG